MKLDCFSVIFLFILHLLVSLHIQIWPSLQLLSYPGPSEAPENTQVCYPLACGLHQPNAELMGTKKSYDDTEVDETANYFETLRKSVYRKDRKKTGAATCYWFILLVSVAHAER